MAEDTQSFTVRLPLPEHEALRHLAGWTTDSMNLLVQSMIRTELRRWTELARDAVTVGEGEDLVREAHRIAFLTYMATADSAG